jgi:sulfoxide reductase heme-binding subunit YedZ
MSIAMVLEMLRTDLSAATGVTHMISYSVRWAVPLIYLVTAASALHALFPGSPSKWLLRNRKHIGLCFAVAMAWQGLFIFLVSNFHREYYFEEIFLLRDEIEGSTGYLFLAAMVATSFEFGRRHLSAKQWKLLHRSGVYFLWAYPFSVYWWDLFYYPDPEPIDYAFYWGGFLAFALRIAAWGKKRAEAGTPSVGNRILGGAIVGCGLLAAGTGSLWQEPVTAFLTAPAWSGNLVLWLPFWPFEPFLPLIAIGLGTLLATSPGPALLRQEALGRIS